MAEIRELEGLQPPTAAASVLSPIRAQAKLIDRWADAYDDLDSAAISRVQIRLGALSAKAAEAGRAAGFEVCGQG